MAWINFAHSYIHAAHAISEKIKLPTETDKQKWVNQVMVIPLLFLLRHVLELALKSVLISYEKDFESEHNLKKLLKEARACLDLTADANTRKWNEIESIVKEFVETKYGGTRMFKEDDINSTSLRYLQVEDEKAYSKLKDINHEDLIKKVSRATVLCEAFTLILDPSVYIYPEH